jgi:hypothetical protein
MSNRSVPVSVRLTPEDATFLASLQREGAITPSDKLRALIEEEKQRSSRSVNYLEALTQSRNVITESFNHIRTAEQSTGTISLFLRSVEGWLTATLATIQSHRDAISKKTEPVLTAEESNLLERKIAEETFSFFETIVRMGLTSTAQCYDKSLLRKRFISMQELIALMHTSLSQNRAN